MMSQTTKHNPIQATAVLPDENGGFTACPALLTEDEAIRYLRLDTLGRKHPAKSLQYYRERGLLKATRISNVNLYLRESLDEFLATMTALTHERRQT
jgi:hypothetical protein